MFGIPAFLLPYIWKIVGALAVVLILFGLYEADNHWCNQACKNQKIIAEATQKAYNEAVIKADAQIRALEAGAEAITKKYEHALTEKEAQTKIAKDATNAKIKASKELADLKLSNQLVQLFNESANQGRTRTEDTTGTVKGNDDSSNPTTGITGTVFFATINENNANAWDCVDRLDKWIEFWGDIKQNYSILPKGS
jgi:hypothetical protein